MTILSSVDKKVRLGALRKSTLAAKAGHIWPLEIAVFL